MTNKGAINIINSLKDYYNDKSEYCEDGYVRFDNEDNEALDRAIKALEAQERLYKDGIRDVMWIWK